ncbi:MAG: hypothetical protein ACYSSK_04395 [Planctomycetota bacterium]
METTCTKYPLMKTIGIQETILLYAKESYEPILHSLKDAYSEMAELMTELINQQLATIEILLEKQEISLNKWITLLAGSATSVLMILV